MIQADAVKATLCHCFTFGTLQMSRTSIVIAAAVIAMLSAAVWLYATDSVYLPVQKPLGSEPTQGAVAERHSGGAPQLTGDYRGARRVSQRSPPPLIKASKLDQDWLDALTLAGNMDMITAEARKNPSLAYLLAHALMMCPGAHSAYRSLEEGEAEGISAAQTAKSLEEIDRVYKKCIGLKGNHLELRYELATIAAKAGIYEANLRYSELATDFVLSEFALRRPEEAVKFAANLREFTLRAAQSREPRALYRAYIYFSEGMYVKADPVNAYRYLSEYNRVVGTPNSSQMLADYGKTLTSSQFRAATRN